MPRLSEIGINVAVFHPVRHCRRRHDGQRGGRSPGHPPVFGQNGSGQDLGQEDGSAAGQGQAETCRRNPG